MKLCKVILTVLLLHTCVTASYESKIERVEKYADFKTTLNHTLFLEGYYANLRHDKGKETYCGITRRYAPNWYGWNHIDAYKRNKNIKWNQRIEVLDYWVQDYYLDIWVKEGFYKLKDQQLANYLFEFRIHAGKAVLVTKKTVNEMGYDIPVNNRFTEEDMTFINKVNKRKFMNRLLQKRLDLYNNIVIADRSQRGFLKNWLKRANNI